MRKLSAIVLFACLGCAVAPGYVGPNEVATSMASHRQNHYGFSIQPPQSRGWRVRANEQRPQEAVYRRDLPTNTHTFIAQAYLIELPSDVPFEQAAIPSGFSDADRYQVIENNHEPYTGPHGRCVRYSTRLADQAAPNAKGEILHLLEKGVVCAHPTIPGAAVRASFSERGLPAELEPGLWQEFEAFVEGLQLESATR